MQFYVILFIRKSKEDKMENFADYIDGCFEQKTDSESEEMKKTKLQLKSSLIFMEKNIKVIAEEKV